MRRGGLNPLAVGEDAQEYPRPFMMRTLLVSLLIASVSAWAQVAPPPVTALPVASNGLGFEAKLVSITKGASKADPDVVIMGSKKTRESKSLLEVRARNLSAAPVEARLEWFFVARNVETKKNYVWDQGQRNLSLPSGSERVEMVESAELARSMTKSTTMGTLVDAKGKSSTTFTTSSHESGSRPYGWIVRMWAGGRMVQVRTSSTEMEALGRSLGPLQ